MLVFSFPGRLCWADPAICSGPCKGSFMRTYSIELVVQFLLFERFIKTSSSKKVGNKNDNSSKVSLSQLSLGGTTFKKVISRFGDCSRWRSSGYWLSGRDGHRSNNASKINRRMWHTVVTAILMKPYSEDSRCWGAEGVVSIGNKGLEVAISLLNLGSWVQLPAMKSQHISSLAFQCHVPHNLFVRMAVGWGRETQ